MPSLFACLPLLLAPLTAAPVVQDPPSVASGEAVLAEASAPRDPVAGARVEGVAPLAFRSGGDVPELLIPRGEHLEYGVHVEVGPVGATVGKVFLDTGVEPYRESMVLLGGGGGGERETGWLKAKAEGSYLFYDLETVLESRYLPQAWPNISYYYRQSGSENRRREIQLGELDGGFRSTYRSDTSKGAPRGQRIWAPLTERDVPVGTMDMLGAVYLARTLLLSEDREPLVFPLLDKTTLWQMTLSVGEEKVIEVPAGRFDAVEIKLEPTTWPGEPEVEKSKFRGLFGIRGTIQLWVERSTGVPVRIEGVIPAGPVNVDCDIFLKAATGTPDAFVSLPEEGADADAGAVPGQAE